MDVESFSLLNSVFHACLVIRDLHRCWGPKPGRLSVFARRASPEAPDSGAHVRNLKNESRRIYLSNGSQALSMRAPNAALVIHYNGIRPTRLVR